MIHLETQEFKTNGDHLEDQIDNHYSTQPAFCLAQYSYHTHKLNWKPDKKEYAYSYQFVWRICLTFYKNRGLQ